MTDPTASKVYRNHNTILAAQLSGVCTGLQVAAGTNQPVGSLTAEFMRRVVADCRQSWEGRFIENVPELTEEATVGDYIIIAEALKASAYVFLSPDDFEEVHGRTTFGLAPKAK